MLNTIDTKTMQSLTSNEEVILQYIFSNKNKVIKMSITELAQNNYVSTSTILRLCKKLNFQGFNDLKFHLKSESIYNYNKLSKDNINNLDANVNNIISNSINRIKNTISNINLNDLNYLVDCLCSKKNIHILGRGLTQVPLEYFYNLLLSLNRPCTFYFDHPLLYRDTLRMNNNDILIIGSSGGYTIPVIKIATLAKLNAATVVAITSNPDSDLTKIVDIVLCGETESKNFYGIDVNSRLSIQFIVEAILELYINRIKSKK